MLPVFIGLLRRGIAFLQLLEHIAQIFFLFFHDVEDGFRLIFVDIPLLALLSQLFFLLLRLCLRLLLILLFLLIFAVFLLIIFFLLLIFAVFLLIVFLLIGTEGLQGFLQMFFGFSAVVLLLFLSGFFQFFRGLIRILFQLILFEFISLLT